MGDQHEEAQHSPDTDQEEDDEEEEDGREGEPHCPPAGEPIDDSVPPQRSAHGPDSFLSSVGHKPRKRCSVLCSVYCVESDFSGELAPGSPAEQLQRPLSDSTPRGSVRGTGELPLSPAGLELELSPFLISSLADKVLMSCRVCLEDKSLKPLPCCKKGVCEECLKRYLSSQVHIGQVEIKCPITECNKHLDESTIVFNLPQDDIIKYKYFLELSRIDSSTKPCPQCKHFITFKRKIHIPTPSKSENKFKIQCPSCQFVWCFKCHAPWHEGVNCRDYKKGDKLLRHWANEIEYGQRNAQKCPRCKVHIQRTEGCDHMTCSQCNTNFCYRCGERYRQLRFFGDHTSNLSIFGCKYRYLPERPHVRRLVRGSVCAGKLLIAPLLIVIGLALGAIAVVIGLFGLPIYCLCKKQRKRTRTGMPW
ncbi:E3 ubiquitin-protein ligase RNF217 [Dendropsophus ebraccatus]|uniref:E3 ubiquitin-protein ligase RNF217 n=1 Tax=Dendropsophus ebraccatus TaxID=150705 RepID=UPI0038315D2F